MKNKLITFVNLQESYSTADKIVAGLKYKEFVPNQDDWIVIVPAGSPQLSLFCALKGIPLLIPKTTDTTDENQCSDEVDEAVDELFPLMPIFRRQKMMERRKKFSKADKEENILEVTFEPEESKVGYCSRYLI